MSASVEGARGGEGVSPPLVGGGGYGGPPPVKKNKIKNAGECF